MESGSTNELVLTRLWYLVGDWEGTGKMAGQPCRVRSCYSWTLGDHFLSGWFEAWSLGPAQSLYAEHTYAFYDPDIDRLTFDFYAVDGSVERAVGRADPRGRLTLVTDRMSCVPRHTNIRRVQRTIWMMAASQWAFTIEVDRGQGWEAYSEGQMRAVAERAPSHAQGT